MKKIFTPFIVASVLLTSCVSREKVVYYQDIEENPITLNKFETIIKPDDLLMIIVSAEDQEAAEPYNLFTNLAVNPNNQAGSAQRQQQLYLVDKDGNIDFPVLGTVNVGNKPKSEVVEDLKRRITGIKNPIVNLRIMNFRVTVQGEVVREGVHTIPSERISLPEVLALSGGLTVYGRRDNILITREGADHQLKTYRVDITKSDFIDSDFYYLRQNDHVYVEPNKTRVNSTAVGPNVSIYMTAISLLLTTTALILTNTRRK